MSEVEFIIAIPETILLGVAILIALVIIILVKVANIGKRQDKLYELIENIEKKQRQGDQK